MVVRAPDVDRLLGLIFLLESKKGSCTGCVPAFGPNGVGWSQKVGQVGRLPDVNRLSL